MSASCGNLGAVDRGSSTYELAGRGLLIGTCSWTDPTLTGNTSFYPRKEMTAEERLRHYADHFPIAEVDSTYYAPPSEMTAGLWVDRTPDGFTFDIKAFRLMTQHPTPLSSLWKDFREKIPEEAKEKKNIYVRDLPRELQAEAFSRFSEALLPLHSSGKLGLILFQLPPYVYPNRGSFGYLKWAAEQLPDYRIAVEFRQGKWMDEEHREDTLSFLDRHGMTYVAVDEPQGFKSSVPAIAAATSDVAEVRFHGRNAETWEAKGISAAERFKYDYQRPEMEEWLPRIEALQERAKETHLLMNNCYADYGIRSAQLLAGLLG